MITTEVENYPGFPKGVQGPELMELFKAQAERFGTRVVTADVTAVDLSTPPVPRDRRREGELAGRRRSSSPPAPPPSGSGIPSEQKFQNYGVSACATCDGALFKGRELVVVGGGDTAMEEATFLTRFATKVTRRPPARGVPRVAHHAGPGAHATPRSSWCTNAVVDEILGELPKPGVTGVRLRDTRDGSTRELTAGGVFVAIGHEPNSKLFRGHAGHGRRRLPDR